MLSSEKISSEKEWINCHISLLQKLFQNCRISRKKEDKGQRLEPDSKVPISTLSPLSCEKRFRDIHYLNMKFKKALCNAMFQDRKICLNRKNATKNAALDFMVRAGKVPQKCKHNFYTS